MDTGLDKEPLVIIRLPGSDNWNLHMFPKPQSPSLIHIMKFSSAATLVGEVVKTSEVSDLVPNIAEAMTIIIIAVLIVVVVVIVVVVGVVAVRNVQAES